MLAEQAQFRIELVKLKEEKAIRRQRIEIALQAVNRLINAVTMQHALHRGLKSAVTALDNLGVPTVSGTEGKKETGKAMSGISS